MARLKGGDRISVSYKKRSKVIKRVYTVVAADAGKNFIVVTNGRYNDTIDRFMIKSGKVKIKVIQGGGKDEMANTLNPVQV